MYAVVVAGGFGQRLWPLSRRAKPKQFLSFRKKSTLLQQTVKRLDPLVKRDRMRVNVLRLHEGIAKEQLPRLKKDNFIIEPTAKNTAPTIGVVATLIGEQDPF